MGKLDYAKTVLTFAEKAAEDIPAPGLKSTLGIVNQLVDMFDTMKGNKEDLPELKERLRPLTNIDTSVCNESLKQRLNTLQKNLKPIVEQCELLIKFHEEHKFRPFLLSYSIGKNIRRMEEKISIQIQDFTAGGGITIEGLVRDMKEQLSKIQDLSEENLALNKQLLLQGHQAHADQVLTNLRNSRCTAAAYNADNTPERCMEHTRVDIIKDLLTHLKSAPDSSQRIILLIGSAGTGKSTIAKTVACRLAEDEPDRSTLAASFFFSYKFDDRNKIHKVPATLAHQLASYNSSFRTSLVQTLDDSSTSILDAAPEIQFQRLCVHILSQLPACQEPWVICLDALDECANEDLKKFIGWLAENITKMPAHVRFFLTGRPNISGYFEDDRLHPLTYETSLDKVDEYIVKADIRRYVEKSLDGSTWIPPSPWKAKSDQIDKIVHRADKLFIFAATAVRFIWAGIPEETVQHLLAGDPLEDLGTLYLKIVTDAIPRPKSGKHYHETYNRSIKVLQTILNMFEPMDVPNLAALLRIDEKALRNSLSKLNAVIDIPPTGAIQILHQSFKEFMMSNDADSVLHANGRSDLACGTGERRNAILNDVLQVLQTNLRFNICELETSYLKNSEMPDLQQKLDTHIPMHLQYCCEFWANHLLEKHEDPQTLKMVNGFLRKKFLFWLEVLSLLKMVPQGQQALSRFIKWSKDLNMIQFAQDAKRFISLFGPCISESTAHIYITALALAPVQSEIAKAFRPDFPGTLQILRGMESWPVMVKVLEGHTDSVNTVAFSPDGTQIASGSDDETLRIWNAVTGAPVGEPLQGHTGLVWAVAFSPDGTQIASGSEDKTLRIWNAVTGAPVGEPLQGHTGSVYTVAFSPDGTQIASGSSDKTLRIWNAVTGAPVGEPLQGHTGSVYTVAFSPDGTQIASGSDDKTLRIWNAVTGAPVGEPLQGHTDWVRAVAFSPDGTQIASGSDYPMVDPWDISYLTAIDTTYTAHISLPPHQLCTISPYWTVQDGWVLSRDHESLFWLPHESREGFWMPLNKLVIGKQQTQLSYKKFMHGKNWVKCTKTM